MSDSDSNGKDSAQFSITDIVTVLSAVAAIAAPLYLFGLLFTVQQIQRVYHVDFAAAWAAGALISKTVAIVNGADALKDPISLIFSAIVFANALAMGFIIWLYQSPLTANWRPKFKVFGKSGYEAFVVVACLIVADTLAIFVPTSAHYPFPSWTGEIVSIVISAILVRKAGDAFLSKKFGSAWRLGILAFVLTYLGGLFLSYYVLPTNNSILPTIAVDSTTQGSVTGGLVAHSDGYWYILVRTKPSGQLVMVRDLSVRNAVVAH